MTGHSIPDLPFDLSERDAYRQGLPFGTFDEIREASAVWWHPPTSGTKEILDSGFYVVAGHADVSLIARDPELFSSRNGGGLRDQSTVPSMVSLDPPQQTRWRRLVGRSFTPNRVKRLEERMEVWADRIIDRIADRGECDFVADVAHLLPLHVIADIVGIPESDRGWVFDELNKMARWEDPEAGLPARAFDEARTKLVEYAAGLTRSKRKSADDDIWSELIHAEVELDDGSMTRFDNEELGVWFMTLALAGSETTRNSLAIGLEAFIQNPEQLGRLRQDPSLMRSTVEEVLRWTTPVLYHRRTITRTTDVAGFRLESGLPVMLLWPAANRDPAVFDAPNRFDIGRWPNDHIAFGAGGPHFCLGANLARREIAIMLGRVIDRLDQLEIAGPSKWNVPGIATQIAVGIDHLPIRYQPRHGAA
jgi:cytochrome P450